MMQQEHELQDYPNQQSEQPTSNTLQQQEFLNRCQFLHNEIGTLRTNVSDISSLHQRSLAEADNGISAQNLERIVADTQALNAGIRDQLKFLANDAAKTPGGLQSLKKKQVDHIKTEFERELRNYQAEEGTFRQRYRDQIARQYRIVNPEASEDEVRQASEMDWGNEGVFQTAVCISSFHSFLFPPLPALPLSPRLPPPVTPRFRDPATPRPSSICARVGSIRFSHQI